MNDLDPKDLIRRDFESIETAAEFWDTHSLADYWEETEPVEFDVELTRRVYWVAIDRELSEKVAERARDEGVSPETLINLWVAERLRSPTS